MRNRLRQLISREIVDQGWRYDRRFPSAGQQKFRREKKHAVLYPFASILAFDLSIAIVFLSIFQSVFCLLTIMSTSAMLAAEDENDAEVRREDQENINRFARLNARLGTVRGERDSLQVNRIHTC